MHEAAGICEGSKLDIFYEVESQEGVLPKFDPKAEKDLMNRKEFEIRGRDALAKGYPTIIDRNKDRSELRDTFESKYLYIMWSAGD